MLSSSKDLFAVKSEKEKEEIILAFADLKNAIEQAISEESIHKASLAMIDCFGERFPEKEDDNETKSAVTSAAYLQSNYSGILHHDGRSA